MTENIKAGQIFAELLLKDDQYRNALRSAILSAAKFEKTSKKQARSILSKWQSTFLQIGTVATVIQGFRSVIREGAQLQAKLANVSTLGNFSAETMQFMTTELKSLSKELRQSPIELAEALYQTISSGATAGAEAIDLLKNSAKLGISGLSSTKIAVEATSKAINVFGKGALSTNRAINIMNRVVQRGVTTMEEFGPHVGRVSTLAKELGFVFEEVGAASALLTKTMPTPIAMTALEGTMRGLTQASDKFAKAGIDIYQVMREEGLGGALKRLNKLTNGNIKSIKEWIPETEALRGVLALIKNDVKDYNKLLAEMKDQTDTVNDAVAKQMDITESKTEGLIIAFKNLADTLFKELQPAYDRFLVVSTYVLDKANKLIATAPEMVVPDKVLQTWDMLNDAFEAGIIDENTLKNMKEAAAAAYELNRKLLDESVAATAKANKEKQIVNVDYEQQRLAAVRASLVEITNAESEALDAWIALKNKKEDEALNAEIIALQNANTERIRLHKEFILMQDEIRAQWQADYERDAAIRRGIEVDAINSRVAREEKEKELATSAAQRRIAQIDADREAITEANRMANERATAIQEFSASVWDAVGSGWANTTANFIANSDEMKDSQQQWAEMADNLWDSMKEKAVSTLLNIVGQQITQAIIAATAWAPAAALADTATFGGGSAAAAAGIGSLFAMIGKFIPKREKGGPVSEGLTYTHNDEYVLSKMQTGQLSSVLSKIESALTGGGSSKSVNIRLTGGDSLTRELIRHMNIQVEDYGVQLTASRTI